MKLLYFAPEHISGTMTTMRRGHEAVGDVCRFLTLFKNRFAFPEDISLNLPWSPTGGWFARAKELRRRITGLPRDPERPTPPGTPPQWQPDSRLAAQVFRIREKIWTPYILRARESYGLDEFDVYQFEMGIEFYRDGRWVRELARRGKGLIAFYHGTDVRNRGVVLPVDDACGLRLTSELDLLHLHPKLEYLYLPIDLAAIETAPFDAQPDVIRIGHAARNRRLKGTEAVIRAVEALRRRGYRVELVLLEGLPHDETMRRQATCHIAVDQLTDLGGWGYGMSSLEFLALGVPVVTRLRPEYLEFIPDHPFLNADETNVEAALEGLVADAALRKAKREAGLAFIRKYHDVMVVLRQFYDYLVRERWCPEVPPALRFVAPPPVRR